VSYNQFRNSADCPQIGAPKLQLAYLTAPPSINSSKSLKQKIKTHAVALFASTLKAGCISSGTSSDAIALRKHQSLAARNLVKRLAEAFFGREEDISITSTKFGQLWLERNGSRCPVSLSHTDTVLAAAVGLEGYVGIDIEAIRRFPATAAVVRWTLSRTERQIFEALARPAQQSYLCRIWTLKEAYTKALGVGLGKRFSTFAICYLDGVHRLCDADGNVLNEAWQWLFTSSSFRDNYVVSLAYKATHAQNGEPDTLKHEHFSFRHYIRHEQDFKA